ncbi:AAA domain-containing protein [Promicromonospora umidemergens]|uniref:AAA domain-containing protein n=1 Tax=Promicromonospora umidemergens TaxID=629679 RepID=A0ABP8WIC9_9MICO
MSYVGVDGPKALHEGVVGQASRLLDFLSAVAREVGPEPVRDVNHQEFLVWPTEVPTHRAVRLGPSDTRPSWLEVSRLPEPESVTIPDELSGLIVQKSMQSPDQEPELSAAGVEAFVDERLPLPLDELRGVQPDAIEQTEDPDRAVDDEPRAVWEAERAGLREEIQTHFTRWRETTWQVWADRTRPAIAARKLYGRLYELHLRAERETATYEVVWGHCVMRCTREGKSIVAPMFVAPMTVEVNPDDASIRVAPEKPAELELDTIEGIWFDGLEALSALRTRLTSEPPDLWDADQRLAVRRQIVAPLGLEARLAEDEGRGASVSAPVLDDGWTLYLRKRPMRQERFYDELAEKLRDEEFLPEALASVVADKDVLDSALASIGQTVGSDDGTANRLLMPLPANDDQERIARQLARSRGVTVQGPPGTGKSHTIVNLVSHLVAQGKRVLVTAQNDQALTVLRDKIPAELRDLSIAVLGSTPAAMEELRSSAQSMQDSISSLDLAKEERRIKELGGRIDELRDSLRRTDLDLVEALRSEQRELDLPAGPARAKEVAEWLAKDRHLDVIGDAVPVGSEFPVGVDEMTELRESVRSITVEDATSALLDLPDVDWLPTAADLGTGFDRLDRLRDEVTALESGGLQVEGVDGLDRDTCRALADEALDSARTLDALNGHWENQLAAEILSNGPVADFTIQQNATVLAKLGEGRSIQVRLAGHEIIVPDGDPAVQVALLQTWRERLDAGKRGLPPFGARELKTLAEATRFDGFPVSSVAQVDLVAWAIQLRSVLRGVRLLMVQAYQPSGIPVPDDGPGFIFAAQKLADRVGKVHRWWSETYPDLTRRFRPLVTFSDPARDAASLRRAGELLGGAAARIEERVLSSELDRLGARLKGCVATEHASPLWAALLSALELHSAQSWSQATEETRRLAAVRGRVNYRERLVEKIAEAGAPRWVRLVVDSRADHDVTGDLDDLPRAWQRAAARTWLTQLHGESDVAVLMERTHEQSKELQRTVVDLASRSARVGLKKNIKDRQRRALDMWLTAIKRIGKGTGKNAVRYQAQAREALPAAMGAVPVWIMPIYRVLENFDPRVSDLFDVVVVDESSQCDLLTLGVLALGEKSVVVGDDKQTSPQAVGINTDRIAALQEQHIGDLPGRRLLTMDESLYSISGRAFPSTILLREHFRCVPEIIAFSNTFYDGKILPLREVTQPQIGRALNAVHVQDGASVKQGSHRVNVREAQTLVDKVAECAANPAYDGLTFGVVTLMSGPQAKIIEDLLVKRLGISEYEKRRLRVGNPPVFQGDERSVVFISVVADDNSFAATRTMHAQWVNVAASRAQDQIWLFHTVDPSTLNAADYRRQLIEHVRDHGDRPEATDLFALTDSKFERDVLKQMLDHSYDVTPQHKVGSYRIDFVVNVAPGERLAIECDGDSFHGPDQWDADVRRQRVLERIGWSFWRIRASRYYLDPVEAMEPLWERLEHMRARAAEAEKVRARQAEIEDERRLRRLRVATVRREQAAPTSTPAASTEAAVAGTLDLDETVAPESRTRVLSATRPSREPGQQLVPSPRRETPGTLEWSTMTDPSAIRAWARAQGFSISDRGRISAEVTAAFQKMQRALSDAVGTPGTVPSASPASEQLREISVSEISSDRLAEVSLYGDQYVLDHLGDIVSRRDGRSLSDAVGPRQAARVRDAMRAVRPHGGRFKVGRDGVMVTAVGNTPTYVTTVTADEWFPGTIG